jgi:hypothetical protein
VSTPIDDGGPAFPGIEGSYAAADSYSNPYTGLDTYPGMTLRDWFAGQALSGIASMDTTRTYAEDAEQAYRYADAMLAARKEKQ